MDDPKPKDDRHTVQPTDPPPAATPPVAPAPARGPWLGRLVWLVLLLLAAAVAWWIHTRPAAEPAAGGRAGANVPLPVVAATAAKGDVRIRLYALGTVTPLATVTVKTQIAGQLVHIDFVEGQEVKQGDPLAEIDSRPYELALQQHQGQLLRDQALLKDAQIQLARFRTLVAQDSIARQQLDTQQSQVLQDEGAIRTDQAMIDTDKLNILYCHITAPVGGRVGLRQVDQGNYVQTSDSGGIVVITQIRPISVVFTLPEDDLPQIRARLKAGATLRVTAYDRAQQTNLATGKLSTIDNQIDTSTGTVKLRAEFDNEDESLFPNQFVNAELLVDTLQGATVVPTAAVQLGAPGSYVYLVNADGSVAVRPVKTGPTDGDKIAVQSGLQPGDRVVVDGADKLRDGAKVTLHGAGQPQAPDNPQPASQPTGQQGGQHRRRNHKSGGSGQPGGNP
jgi:multidrug efflux system membrane fusion protein